MNEQAEISQQEIERFYEQLKKDAAAGGYNLNPDVEFTKSLARGLLEITGDTIIRPVPAVWLPA